MFLGWFQSFCLLKLCVFAFSFLLLSQSPRVFVCLWGFSDRPSWFRRSIQLFFLVRVGNPGPTLCLTSHRVWWCFDYRNSIFRSLTFVQFSLIFLCRLAILVFYVPMFCQQCYWFEILALSYGSLFQLVLCKTDHWNLTLHHFLFDESSFKNDKLVDELWLSKWPCFFCSSCMLFCQIHFDTFLQLSTKSWPFPFIGRCQTGASEVHLTPLFLHLKQGKIIFLRLTRKRSSLCSWSFQPPQLASVEVFRQAAPST